MFYHELSRRWNLVSCEVSTARKKGLFAIMADKNGNTSANLGFEDKLWKAADVLRSNMDAAEYKHVVLGLIFLKYISDTFEKQHARLEAERAQGADRKPRMSTGPPILLGAQRGPLGVPARKREAAHDR